MSVTDDLSRLADLAGVARRYRDAYGKEVESPVEGLRAVLGSLGYEVETDGQIAKSLSWADRESRKLVRATVPLEAGRDTSVGLADISGGEVEWRLTFEDGSTRDGRDTVHAEQGGASFPLDGIPEGYHHLHVSSGDREAEATLIAAPGRC